MELIPLLQQQPDLFKSPKQHISHLIGKKCAISLQQITRICCQENGLLNLNAFIKYYETIRAMGFDFSKILSILDWHEAHHILPIINKWASKLLNKSLKIKEVLFLFQIIYDETQITQYLPYVKDLIKLNLSKEHLFYILSMNLLDKTIQLYRSGIKLGFNTHDICNLLNTDKKHDVLEQVIDNYAAFKNIGLKNHDLMNIALKQNSKEILELIIVKFPKLIQENFCPSKLLSIVLNGSGIENITMLHKLSEKLNNLGFTRNEILNMANHPNGAFRIQALSTRAQDLILLKHTPIKILMMVLDEIDTPGSVLYQDDMFQYLREMHEERESYFLSQLNLEFFSMFAPTSRYEEMNERLNMSLEDIESQENSINIWSNV